LHRDMNLVLEILLEMEKRQHSDVNKDLQTKGYSVHAIAYHVKLMAEEGLIEAVDFSSHTSFAWKPTSLTSKRHELLDGFHAEA
jgi:repressor of nif and glnA expression